MTLQVGDVVLVIGADSPRQPQPGSIGTVHSACDCMVMCRIEGYYVTFDGRRASCYFRRQLRKLEPPAEDDQTHRETKRPRKEEVS